jgi:hypothetical protein
LHVALDEGGIMASIRGSALTIAVVVALGSTAQAATLATPILEPISNQQLICFVSNLDTKPARVSVTLIDHIAQVAVPTFDDCNGIPLPAGTTCDVVIAAGNDGRCVIVANTGKIRATLQLIDTSTEAVLAVVPATK